MDNNEKLLTKYIDNYIKGIHGDKVAEARSRILWNCLPREYRTALLESRCRIPNCSTRKYASMLSELRSGTRPRILESDHNRVEIR